MSQPRFALDNAETRARKLPSPWAMFLSGFFKRPVMVGSIIASSKAQINAMLKVPDWPNVKLFVEYGPGVGTFTRPRQLGHVLLSPRCDERGVLVHRLSADCQGIEELRSHFF